MDDDIWLGDDEEEPLPLLAPDGHVAPPDIAVPSATPHRRPTPHGNVKTADAEDARKAALAEATGQTLVGDDPEDWRDQLANGKRYRAASSLEAGGRRPGSSSGFGLA